jgi:hypothetical protein
VSVYVCVLHMPCLMGECVMWVILCVGYVALHA